MAASATFALKAGVRFRRGRLLMVSPDSRSTACPPSGRNSTYRPVQISGASSAQAAYDKALAVNPDLAPAWVARGNIFYGFFRDDQAEVAYDNALALKPDLAEAWVGRGNVLDRLQRHDEAAAAFDKALAIDSGLKYVAGGRLYEKQFVCDWTAHDAETARLLAAVREGKFASAPFPLLSIS